MRPKLLIASAILLALAAPLRAADDQPLPTTAEIRRLVDTGQYKDALKPLFRLLALKGSAAAGYDRWELLMLRAECQMQIKDQRAALDSLDLAHKEAFAQKKFEKMAEPVALTLLIKNSAAWKYKPKGAAPAQPPVSILDRTLRPSAYAALYADEYSAASKKARALNNAKSLGPVIDAAKSIGAVRAVEIMTKPPDPNADPAKLQLQTTELCTLVTTNADRLLSTAIDDISRQVTSIGLSANQIVKDNVPMYDQGSGKAWLQPRTRRRGVSDPEAQTLNATLATCDKIHATAAEIATALTTDFDAYQAIVTKADNLRIKASNILNDDYLQIPAP